MVNQGMRKVKNRKRETWQSENGQYWQWDSLHGKLEKWDTRKKNHLGEFDPKNGKQTKHAEKSRTFDE
jgi:toxin YxiD